MEERTKSSEFEQQTGFGFVGKEEEGKGALVGAVSGDKWTRLTVEVGEEV